MFILLLDSEQAAIVKASLTFADDILTARLLRADPDGQLSKAFGLQQAKTANLHRQLDTPLLKRIEAMGDIFTGSNSRLVALALNETPDDDTLRARERLKIELLKLLGGAA